MERETGIEPATNGLGSRYSTIELLPLEGLKVDGSRNGRADGKGKSVGNPQLLA